jgi:hypothetical protein
MESRIPQSEITLLSSQDDLARFCNVPEWSDGNGHDPLRAPEISDGNDMSSGVPDGPDRFRPPLHRPVDESRPVSTLASTLTAVEPSTLAQGHLGM